MKIRQKRDYVVGLELLLEGSFKVSGNYEGECRISYIYDGKLNYVMEGEFIDGYLEGQGQIKYYDEEGNIEMLEQGIFTKSSLFFGEKIIYDKEGEMEQVQKYENGDIENKN